MRILIILILYLANINFLHSQCPGYQVCPDKIVPLLDIPPTYCQNTSDCSGLISGNLVLSFPDTTVIDAIDENTFYADDYSGCIAFASVCVDLNAVQNLIEILNNTPSCCGLFNIQASGFCNKVKMHFSSGDEVQSFSDILTIIEEFDSSSLTLGSIINNLKSYNNIVPGVQLFCDGLTEIAYCADPTIDFYDGLSNIYEINSEVCPFPDCIDTITITPTFLYHFPHQSIYKASKLIQASGFVGSFENFEFRAGEEVILVPDFSLSLGAILDINIEECH